MSRNDGKHRSGKRNPGDRQGNGKKGRSGSAGTGTEDSGKKPKQKRTQWHPVICDAIELDLAQNNPEITAKGGLSIQREYTLGQLPLSADMLIIKTGQNDKLSDPVGSRFARCNIVEIKGVDEACGPYAFWQAVQYAIMYLADHKGEVPLQDMSCTIICGRISKKLEPALKASGLSIAYIGRETPSAHAIVIGPFGVPVQIVVSSGLPFDEYPWLVGLYRRPTVGNYGSLMKLESQLKDELASRRARTVLGKILDKHPDLIKELEEADLAASALDLIIEDWKKKTKQDLKREIKRDITRDITRTFNEKLKEAENRAVAAESRAVAAESRAVAAESRAEEERKRVRQLEEDNENLRRRLAKKG